MHAVTLRAKCLSPKGLQPMFRNPCFGRIAITAALFVAAGMHAGAQNSGDKGHKVVGKLPSGQDLTPAQMAYGLPKNPVVGGPVDTDLSKALTLERAIAIGLAYHNSIAISKTAVDQAAAHLTQARSSYFPQVTPSYSYSSALTPTAVYSYDPVTGLPVSRLPNRSVSSDTQTSSIVLKQLLYDMGQREASVAQSRRSVFAAEYGLANQRQVVILDVSQDYYNLLRNRELVKEDVKSVERYRATLDIITTQANVGTAAKSDIFQAKADLANAEVTLLQDQSNYKVAEATLKNAMGIAANAPLVLPDASLPAPKIDADKTPLTAYLETAYSNRLDSKQQQENVNASGYAVKLAKIQSGFSVDASIQEGYAGNPISGEERLFSVSVSYPLFDGGNARAAVKASQAALEEQKRSLDQIQQNIRLDVEQSYQVREIARQRVTAAQVALDAGEENLKVVRAKELNQLAGLPDIIAAERQRDAAGISLVQAIYDYYVATAALKRSIGVNDLAYHVNVPNAKPSVKLTVEP
jgi:outer membrane protein